MWRCLGRFGRCLLFLRLFLSAGLSLAYLTHTFPAHAVDPPPNIVLIFSDDQGWTSTSVQMDPNIPESKSDFIQTPSLERLAAVGMRFGSAYAEPICTPSRAALQTGKSPAQLQMTDITAAAEYDNSWYGRRYNGEPLSPPIQPRNLIFDQDTIAEHLKQVASAYKSAHFWKWDVSRDGSAASHGYDFTTFTHDSSEYGPGGDPKKIFSATDTAIDFMDDRVNAGEPFYLQISHFAPHGPYEARPATLDKYNNLPPGIRHDNPLVAAMTEDLDTGVGMLLDKIDQLGIKNNTYVIYMSDNGGVASLGTGNNAPLFQAKGTVFEGGVRVPMIVSGPGIEAGSFSNVPVTIRDIFATVSDLVGNPSPLAPDLESASLVPLFENGGQLPVGMDSLQRGFAPNGEIFFYSPHYQQQPAGFTDRLPQSAVRDGDFKLVRLFGENDQPDQVFLFDLAANVTESQDLNSPLNLADEMPGKTAQLLAKLDKWLEDTDASLPYQVWDDIELQWDAQSPGSDPDAWRSTIDVDQFFRERWEKAIGQVGPTRIQVESHQPKLADHAFRFDGSQGLTRHFFHVSDNKLPDVYDADHSATFEFWLQTDDLTQEQLIFETGDSYAGLSVTLGDGDGDGVHDEVRVRVKGGDDGGQSSLVVTSELDKFADPTKDFVQVSVVVNDDDSDRYLELYVNGALFGRADGVAGPGGRLSWDDWNIDLDFAGLGMMAGDGIGGTGGAGDQPFAGGNFKGKMALFRYFNHALNSSTIQSHYNSVLAPVGSGVRSATGDSAIPPQRPTDVSLTQFESSALMVVHERDDLLDAALPVDALVQGATLLSDPSQATPGELPAGANFSSFLLQFDPLGQSPGTLETVVGSIDFEGEILAILFDPATLAATDNLLGSIGDYGVITDRGLLLGSEGFLGVSTDRHTLSFGLNLPGDELLQFRVLTEFISEADFNADGLVDSSDLSLWESAYGLTDVGDADGDGDTDGDDFLRWQQLYNGVPAPSADFDNSGQVDGTDLTIWEASFGVNESGDADRDGDTDGMDFLIWQQQFTGSALLAALTEVPEPSSSLLLVGLAAIVTLVRFRADS